MAITLVHSDASPVYDASATSVSVTIDASVSTGDLIVILYMTRSVVTVPSGFTKYAEGNDTNLVTQYQGFLVKTSDGTEGGTSVTVAQASAGRIEAFHCIFGSTGTLSVSKTGTVDGGTASTITMSALTESVAFAAIANGSNVYSSWDQLAFGINAASDVEWARLNTTASTGSGTSHSNRVGGFYALYSGADTTALTLDVNETSKDTAGSMITLLESGADTTAPTLTSASGTQTGATTADLSVSTDEGNGTLYFVVTTSATAPSVAQVQAGQDHTGSAAVDSGSQSVSGTGTQSASATGLTASTAYYAHFQHADAAANDSTVASSATFTTAAAIVKGVQVNLNSGATDQASITGITAMWWDASPPTGNPVFTTSTASTDVSGNLELDLDADTALAVTDPGHLIVYKLDGTDQIDSLAWQGRLLVQDIS